MGNVGESTSGCNTVSVSLVTALLTWCFDGFRDREVGYGGCDSAFFDGWIGDWLGYWVGDGDGGC